jgi:hypothetical protein
LSGAPDSPSTPSQRVSAWVRILLQLALLVGPTLLAFKAGGYFDGPRTVAAVVAWVLLALAAVGAGRPHAASWVAAGLALGGLTALTAWVGISSSWATLAGTAQDDFSRDLLYLPVLALGLWAWRTPRALRAVEPVLAAGTLVVVGYGLAGRLLPSLVELQASASAGGRLEQPMSYWNAMGALAAMGLVLCARLAGDHGRRPAVRIAAATAAGPLGLGLYLSFSRGALAAAAVGIVLVALLAPTKAQWRACVLACGAGAVLAAVSSRLSAVESLQGTPGQADSQGAAMLAVLVAVCAVTALLARLAVRREGEPDVRGRPLPYTPLIAVGAVVVGLGVPMAAAAVTAPPENASEGASVRRLGDVSSNRYQYWKVAVREAADHPLRGIGSGSFDTAWTRERKVAENARDAHSLVLETAAELGIVGLAALAALLTGVALALRDLYRRSPALAVGPVTALATWFVHANLDWDWEMPALTLVALVLAGAALGAPRDGLSAAGPD